MRWFYLIGCITLLLCYRRGCFLWVSTYLGASNKKNKKSRLTLPAVFKIREKSVTLFYHIGIKSVYFVCIGIIFFTEMIHKFTDGVIKCSQTKVARDAFQGMRRCKSTVVILRSHMVGKLFKVILR